MDEEEKEDSKDYYFCYTSHFYNDFHSFWDICF